MKNTLINEIYDPSNGYFNAAQTHAHILGHFVGTQRQCECNEIRLHTSTKGPQLWRYIAAPDYLWNFGLHDYALPCGNLQPLPFCSLSFGLSFRHSILWRHLDTRECQLWFLPCTERSGWMQTSRCPTWIWTWTSPLRGNTTVTPCKENAGVTLATNPVPSAFWPLRLAAHLLKATALQFCWLGGLCAAPTNPAIGVLQHWNPWICFTQPYLQTYSCRAQWTQLCPRFF